jgi:hypothetical protein
MKVTPTVLGHDKTPSLDMQTSFTIESTVGANEGGSPEEVVVTVDPDMYSAQPNPSIVDLYYVESEDKQHNSTPFLHTVQLQGTKGEIVWIKSTFDDSALVNAIDTNFFKEVKHRLTPLQTSGHILCMADGRLWPSKGAWTRKVTVADMPKTGTFEVFDSNGAWLALFSKPLLEKFKAVHNYDSDTVKILNNNDWKQLQNKHQYAKRPIQLTTQELSDRAETMLRAIAYNSDPI